MAKPKKPAKKTTSTTVKPRRAKKDPALAKLPPALRDRAQALEDLARDRLKDAAQAALDDARAALEQTARGYYALGRALLVLRQPGHAEALGFASFRALYENGIGISKSSAERLLDAVEALSAAQYAKLGPARVDALLDLAAATPADDTREILAGEVITLWEDGPKLDVSKSSTPALRAAAVQVREHVAKSSGRRKVGKSSSAEERTLAREGADALRAAGSKASAKTRATKPGRASIFDVMGLDADEFRAVIAALRKHGAKRVK